MKDIIKFYKKIVFSIFNNIFFSPLNVINYNTSITYFIFRTVVQKIIKREFY